MPSVYKSNYGRYEVFSELWKNNELILEEFIVVTTSVEEAIERINRLFFTDRDQRFVLYECHFEKSIKIYEKRYNENKE